MDIQSFEDVNFVYNMIQSDPNLVLLVTFKEVLLSYRLIRSTR